MSQQFRWRSQNKEVQSSKSFGKEEAFKRGQEAANTHKMTVLVVDGEGKPQAPVLQPGGKVAEPAKSKPVEKPESKPSKKEAPPKSE